MQINPNTLFVADPHHVLQRMESEKFDLVLFDPPYFGGFLFDLSNPQNPPYGNFDEYLEYIVSILLESYRVLKPSGSALVRINPLSPFCFLTLNWIPA